MSWILRITKIVSSCSEAKVSATMHDIDIERPIIIKQPFEIILEIIDIQPMPILSPMSQPSRVHLTTKYQSITEGLWFLKKSVLVQVLSLTDAYARSVPIVLLPIAVGVFIVKIALDFEVLPHLEQVESMLVVFAVWAELILDLEQDDVASVYFQEGFDYLRQGFEVD